MVDKENKGKKKDIEISDSLEGLFGTTPRNKALNHAQQKNKDIISQKNGEKGPVFREPPSHLKKHNMHELNSPNDQKETNRSNFQDPSLDPLNQSEEEENRPPIKEQNQKEEKPKIEMVDFTDEGIVKKNKVSTENIKPRRTLGNTSSTEVTKSNLKNRGNLKESYLNEGGYFQCPHGLEQIPITRKAFQDMILVAKGINEISKERWGRNSEKLEVYMYCFADKEDIDPETPSRISSIYIPYHTAAEARVDVSEQGILEVKNYIEKTGKVLLGWSHSHGHFEVYSSQTDEINHQTLLNETSNYLDIPPFQLKYIYGITINDEAQRYGVILTNYPCGHIERNVDQDFDIQGEPYGPEEKKERYEELKKILEDRAHVIQPQENKSKEEILDTLTEELILAFLRNLDKAKDLLFNTFSDEEEKQFALIQKLLENYDDLLIDGTEETFKIIAKKMIKAFRSFEEGV